MAVRATALEHGAEIAVGGGGPAGCAFAAALLSSAQMRGLRLSVRVYDVPETPNALPPVVIGPVARHRLAALGVALQPDYCATEVRGLLVVAGERSELIPVGGGTAWVVDGWPTQSPGTLLLQRLLSQAAALRGARFVPRPVDEAAPLGDALSLRAGGSPERAQILAVARPIHAPELGLGKMPTRDAVRARLFASSRAAMALGGLVRVFVAPAPGVEFLVAIPAASSVHLTAYGPRVGATELALAVAELRRRGALPDGLEIAELARARVPWGMAGLPRHPRVLAIGDAGATHPLDPLGPALEQGQRAAIAVAESSLRLEELPYRSAGLLEGARADVGDSLRALARLVRAGPLGPSAVGRATIRESAAGGIFFGLGPRPAAAAERLLGPAFWGPLARLLRDQGPGMPPELRPERPIFVVDDDPAQRTLVCEYLAARHLPVRAMGDEVSLLAAATEEPPRAVVLDVVLNWVDGLRLCRSLRSHPATRNIPVILMSGLSRASDRRAALSAGATAFFPKPLDLEALAAQLEQLKAS